jgi:hypothetical protein
MIHVLGAISIVACICHEMGATLILWILYGIYKQEKWTFL